MLRPVQFSGTFYIRSGDANQTGLPKADDLNRRLLPIAEKHQVAMTVFERIYRPHQGGFYHIEADHVGGTVSLQNPVPNEFAVHVFPSRRAKSETAMTAADAEVKELLFQMSQEPGMDFSLTHLLGIPPKSNDPRPFTVTRHDGKGGLDEVLYEGGAEVSRSPLKKP